MLIGRFAHNINLIKQQSGAMITVKSKTYAQHLQVVIIEGVSELFYLFIYLGAVDCEDPETFNSHVTVQDRRFHGGCHL